MLDLPTVSNRHCIVFNENKNGKLVAVLEDLSSNGTFVNEVIVGRNKRRELDDGDQISILDEARFTFRYPLSRTGNAFRQQYRILQQLGKGHFATVYLCVERATGVQYAVKRFEKRPGDSQSKADGLQQEIGVLKAVSHPNMLCLQETFDEDDGVYLVLELAPEGELFNTIVLKQKLTEEEARNVFVQLFQGIRYLVGLDHPRILMILTPAARTEYRSSGHQTRKYLACRQASICKNRRFWPRKNHWGRIIHLYTVCILCTFSCATKTDSDCFGCRCGTPSCRKFLEAIAPYLALLMSCLRCRPRNLGKFQTSEIHSCGRRLVLGCRSLHMPMRFSSIFR